MYQSREGGSEVNVTLTLSMLNRFGDAPLYHILFQVCSSLAVKLTDGNKLDQIVYFK